MKATFTSSRSFTQFQVPSDQAIRQTLGQFWNSALTFFAASPEPTVHFVKERNGSQWTAYDPMNHQSVTVDSELEMRIWLENRYYGSTAN